MSAVQWIVRRVAASSGVRTQLPASEHCLTVWHQTPPGMRQKFPQPGDIIIWQHGDTQSGHTGIVKEVHPNHLVTLEGNTGAGPGVEREGDGFYERKRMVTRSGDMRVLGFIRPFI
jgi:hypothetical protein